MKKNMVYFVLYVVLITELLIVITERDELQEMENQIRDKMLSTLAESYKQPLLLTIPQKKSLYDVGSQEPAKVILTPAGFVSDLEKEKISFTIDVDNSSRKQPPGWPSGGVTSESVNKNFRIETKNGNAMFVANLKNIGEYKFRAFCEVERQLPDYLPDNLSDSLNRLVGELKIAKSNEENFLITARRIGSVESKKAEVSF